MSGRLIGLNKYPVVRSVGLGETWWRILSKCSLVVMEVEAKESCGMEQLCGGLEAGIEGDIHAVRLLWQQHYQKEDWVFFLIDMCNAFNE